MKHPQLTAEKRAVLGKAVKKLRREGFLPANVYGKALSSVAVQVKTTDFNSVYEEVGETGLVDLMLDGERRPVLIKNYQLDYRANKPLHVDFYQVNLKEKVKSWVPLEFTGEATAVAEKLGMLLTPIDEVEVEALPESLPEKLEVDVTSLAQVGDTVTIADIKAPEGVELLDEPSMIVAQIGELAQAEPEPSDEAPQMPEVIGEKKEEGEEGAEASEEK